MAVAIVNREYLRIVKDIVNSEEFNKLRDMEQHGITRYDHSVKVSYYAYKISKFLKLDYVSTARGGLLHDFFLTAPERTKKDKLVSTFTHPKIAQNNAHYIFMTNIKEDDIIVSHMFPFYKKVPKYAESWVVNLTDKVIGTTEFVQKFDYQLSYLLNLSLLFIINNIIK